MSQLVEYSDGTSMFEGFLAPAGERRPCVLVAHAWDGPNNDFRALASELGELG